MKEVQQLKEDKLQRLRDKIIGLNIEYEDNIQQARDNLSCAMRTRWEYGKIVYENYNYIIDKCGTQKEFADLVGDSEGVVSNNKRGYKYLKEEGCETWDDVVQTLTQKQIPPTVTNFEKIGRLLNEPREETRKKTQIEKDRKRLEELRAEAEEILRRNEPGAVPSFIEDGWEFVEDIEEIQSFLDSFNPKKSGWESNEYLDFVRNYGYDILTGEQLERADPHHTDEFGNSGPTGQKLPDTWVIPVSRETHNKLESGQLQPSKDELQEALITTLMSFIQFNLR